MIFGAMQRDASACVVNWSVSLTRTIEIFLQQVNQIAYGIIGTIDEQ